MSGRASRKTQVAGLYFDVLSEDEVIRHVISQSRHGIGGWIVTPNVDICRQVHRDSALQSLVASASLIVPDGMPLIWAAKIMREPLTARVTGSSLIFTLTQAAVEASRSIYLLGGEPGVPELARENLSRRYPGLKVAGTDSPPLGFDKSIAGVEAASARVRDASPDIVFVGLGFPKQEYLMAKLSQELPSSWFIGCGAAVQFAAGTTPRAPAWMQQMGLEWFHRLMREPRRLFRRYLIDDMPFAAHLLIRAAAKRVSRRSHPQ
jgi:N-acetylglucosaminyldiphosphoundecaprenol N-acetyl-beta-D-mannosaminyltransferase